MRMDRTTQRGAWIKNGMFICKLRVRAAARKGKDYQLGWALIMQYQTKKGGWILDTMQHRRNGMILALEPSGSRRGAGDSVHDGSGL